MKQTPNTDEVRPGRCPCCGEPSRPAGKALGLRGHGLRERQQLGPLEPDDKPAEIVVAGRRYRCRGCGAVIVVVPRGMLPRRRYSASAIGWALALFGLRQRPMAEVRRRTSPWRIVGAAAAAGWAALSRWVDAIRERRLFARVRAAPTEWTKRQVAERAAGSLAAHAPTGRGRAIEAQAFFGAALTA